MTKRKSRYIVRFAELAKRKEKAFIPFVVLGDPDGKTSFEILKALLKHADCLELGLPFSDPIADGKTIQAADQRALGKGMNTDRAFALIKRIRRLDGKIPIGLLVYYNLVYRRGVGKFYNDAKKAGVDGILIADMPLEESQGAVRAARANAIDQIFLVTQTTTAKRMKKILHAARGFVYLVSVLGVTGARHRVEGATIALVKRARARTKLPLCVGFGVSKPEHVKMLSKAGANGAIIGSALTEAIARNLGKNCKIKRFCKFQNCQAILKKKKMLGAIDRFCARMKAATKTAR